MGITIRPFDRRDRDQLTALINAHVAAVVPGVGLSVNTVLSQLEREPSETVVDPWVAERRCVVALRDDAVAAAALLHRFRDDADVGEGYRGAGDIRWLLCDRDDVDSGARLMGECLATFDRWRVTNRFADGSLPALGCYGVPDTWPHVRRLYAQAGFVPAREELVLVAQCVDLVIAPLDDVTVQRSVGRIGARLELSRAGALLGYIEVGEHSLDMARSTTATHWTDVGNLFVIDGQDRGEVMPGLLSAAARWLLLGGVERLVDYYADDVNPPDYLAGLYRAGFTHLVTNQRGWQLR